MAVCILVQGRAPRREHRGVRVHGALRAEQEGDELQGLRLQRDEHNRVPDAERVEGDRARLRAARVGRGARGAPPERGPRVDAQARAPARNQVPTLMEHIHIHIIVNLKYVIRILMC